MASSGAFTAGGCMTEHPGTTRTNKSTQTSGTVSNSGMIQALQTEAFSTETELRYLRPRKLGPRRFWALEWVLSGTAPASGWSATASNSQWDCAVVADSYVGPETGTDLTVTGNLTVNGNATVDNDLTVLGDGKVNFGSGTGSPDTLLRRGDPNQLTLTNDTESAYGTLNLNRVVLYSQENQPGTLQIQPDIKITRTNNNEVSLQNLSSENADLKLGAATINNQLNLPCEAPRFTPLEIVNAIYHWDGEEWSPEGFPASDAESRVTFSDTHYSPTRKVDLFEIISEDQHENPNEIEPLLATNVGLVVQKDIAAGGFVSSNQGQLLLGHGRQSSTEPPRIILMHSENTIPYPTLYITRWNSNPNVHNPANIDVGDATMHGNLVVSGTITGNVISTGNIDTGCVASAGGIQVNRFVSITADNTVSMASRSNSPSVFGVAAASASQGQTAQVITSGRAQVVAAENLFAGDRVTTDESGCAIRYSSHSHSKGTLTLANNNPVTGGPSDSGVSVAGYTHAHTVAFHSHGGSTGNNNPGTSGPDSGTVSVAGETHSHTVASHGHSVTALGIALSNVGGTTASANGPGSHSHGFSGGAAVDIAHGHGNTGNTNPGTSGPDFGMILAAGSAHSHTVASHGHAISAENPTTSGPNNGTIIVASNNHYHTVVPHAHTFVDGGVTSLVATGEPEYKVLVGATTGNLATIWVQ